MRDGVQDQATGFFRPVASRIELRASHTGTGRQWYILRQGVYFLRQEGAFCHTRSRKPHDVGRPHIPCFLDLTCAKI